MMTKDQLLPFLNKRSWMMDIIYSYPFSVIIYQAFWSWIFIWITPWIGWLLFFKNVLFAIDSFIRMLLGISTTSNSNSNKSDLNRIKPTSRQQELAICITNCDSGYGRDITLELSRLGYIVFAGCLSENGKRQYAGRKRIIPIRLDVTKSSDVTAAYDTISRWINQPSSSGSISSSSSVTSTNSSVTPRYFHALINNNSTATSVLGIADMLTMDDYEHNMNASFFGSVRMIKTFLPILKQQSIDQTYNYGRIIQVSSSSSASVTTTAINKKGHTCCDSTNLAINGFIDCIREELKTDFDIDVIHVKQNNEQRNNNISMQSQQIQNVWNAVPLNIKNQYGEEYFQTFRNHAVLSSKTNKAAQSLIFGEQSSSSGVNNEHILDAIELHNPPPSYGFNDPMTLVSKLSPLLGLVLPESVVTRIVTNIILKVCYNDGRGSSAVMSPTSVKPAAMTKLSAGY